MNYHYKTECTEALATTLPLFDQLRNLNIWEVHVSILKELIRRRLTKPWPLMYFFVVEVKTETLCVCVCVCVCSVLWSCTIHKVKGENVLMLIDFWKLLLGMSGLWGLSHSSIQPQLYSHLHVKYNWKFVIYLQFTDGERSSLIFLVPVSHHMLPLEVWDYRNRRVTNKIWLSARLLYTVK